MNQGNFEKYLRLVSGKQRLSVENKSKERKLADSKVETHIH
jgi:hypothetical protein